MVNPQLVVTASMFVLSEMLPYLPCKQNSLLQLAVSGLNKAKLIPNDVYANFESAATNSTSTKPSKQENAKELNVRITFAFEGKPKCD